MDLHDYAWGDIFMFCLPDIRNVSLVCKKFNTVIKEHAILQHIVKTGWTDHFYAYTASIHRVDLFKFAYQNNLITERNLCGIATTYNDIDCLKYAYAFYPFETSMRYAIKRDDMMFSAIVNNSFECFKYLFELVYVRNSVLNSDICSQYICSMMMKRAISNGSFECLKYLSECGSVVLNHLVRSALHKFGVKYLQYFIDKQNDDADKINHVLCDCIYPNLLKMKNHKCLYVCIEFLCEKKYTLCESLVNMCVKRFGFDFTKLYHSI